MSFYQAFIFGVIVGFAAAMFALYCLDVWCQRREEEQREDGERE